MAADEHHVGLSLCNSGSDRAHADLGHELHRDAGRGIGALEVENELRQVLDGVDIMVRGRGDEHDAGRGVAHFGNNFIDLVSGQLAAFARFGALGHLDLQLARVHQIVARNAEPRRRHLFDRALFRIAVCKRDISFLVLAAFPGIRGGAEPVHGDRQGFVRLLADRAERHCRCHESFDY